MGTPRLLLELAGLLALAVLASVPARWARVPLSVVLVVVGLVAGAVGLAPDVGRLEGEVLEEVVILVLLPALVFAAALGVDVRAFVRDLGAVLALATVAFLASVVLVGVSLHVVLGTTLGAALVFGALVSATDPVAVVAVFREVGVPRRLLTLVEGESLLNDGVAIVLTAVLVEAAVGGEVDLAAGAVDFVAVFAGGAVIGAVLGLLVALLLPWLDRLAATALSVALAYGSFVLADVVLGFSGVMATAAAGMVLGGLAPSRAAAPTREAWEQTWESVDFVVNALLFFLVGLVIGLGPLLAQLGAVALALVVVVVSRGLAVIPVVWLLERVAHVPRLGRRNEAVLVWGGLRGGVALALALALPEELPQRDLLVTLTGGVVLGTLLLNATTIRWLVGRLGLDRPGPADRYLLAVARLSAVQAAESEARRLGLHPGEVTQRALDDVADSARAELAEVHLGPEAEHRVVVGRGLHVERRTYQWLSDEGLLPPTVTRTLLHEVDDEIDDLSLRGDEHELGSARRRSGGAQRYVRALVQRLPRPVGEDATALAYAEATARRIAARRSVDALEDLAEHAPVDPAVLRRAAATFAGWEEEAVQQLAELDERTGRQDAVLHEAQVRMLVTAAESRELHELVESGVLPAEALPDA